MTESGSQPSDLYTLLGLSHNHQHQHQHQHHGGSKASSILDISKAYKYLTTKWHPSDHKSSHSSGKSQANRAKLDASDDSHNKELHGKKHAERIASSGDATTSPANGSSPPHRNGDDSFFFRRRPSFLSKSSSRRSHTPTPSSVSRSTSRRSHTPTPSSFSRSMSRSTSRRSHTPTPTSFSRSTSRRSTTPTSTSFSGSSSRRCNSTNDFQSLSRNKSNCGAGSEPTTPNKMSRAMSRTGSNKIVFSQSAARRRPQPIEKKLECTLEELCFGCIKKVTITRDVITETGTVEQEEDTLKINVKPGWVKGMKITFEGKGDEKPGYLPADIVFVVDEVRHPLFKRKGDDLEIAVEILLVQALTGGMLSVPLLGGEKMSVLMEEIIHPGYEMAIPGKGMPCFQEEGERESLGSLSLFSFLMNWAMNSAVKSAPFLRIRMNKYVNDDKANIVLTT